MDPNISAIQLLQGILAAMALNRALTSIHFKGVDNGLSSSSGTNDAKKSQ
jgi:hypothetical protein